MRLLLYYTSNTGVGESVRKIIQPLMSADKLEIFRTVESFSLRIRRLSLSDTIVVLVAANLGELQSLLNMTDILSDNRVILILPDHEEKTVACGHKFFPRFLSYADSDLTDLLAVLSKLAVCKSEHSQRFGDKSWKMK